MRTAVLVLTCLASMPAIAGETPWQEISPGVRLRMISSDVLQSGGTTRVGLELDMPASTKTYWRIPGEAGIPTELDLSGSNGVVSHSVVWPHPSIETVGGLTDFVYRGPTVLPIDLTLDREGGDLKASVVMGVCSDICVPAMASFSLPLAFSRPDRGQDLRLRQAEARAPVPWSETKPPLGTPSWEAAPAGLRVPVADTRVDPMTVIVDSGSAGQLYGAPQKSPDGSSVFLPLLGAAGKATLEGKSVNLDFMTEMGPFSLSTTVTGGSTAGTR